MPPRKAKHEINSSLKTPVEKSTFAQPESENSPAQIEIQQTKFEGILELSPVQQLSKDLEHAIEDNITSPNKSIHGSINHLKLRELMDVGREVNTQEEAIVEKLKSSILVDVKGMADEIISGITSAGYDILRDVFTETAPQLLKENEILKNMLTHLTEQVLQLKLEIVELKKLSTPVFLDNFQSGPLQPNTHPTTEQLPNFRIQVKSPISQPATDQTTFQEGNNAQNSTPPRENFENLRRLTSPEEDSDYEQEPDHSSNAQALYDQHFPAIAKNRPTISPTRNNATTYAKRGWAIAASSLPVPISNALRNVPKHPHLSHLEISGELPDFLNSVHGANFLLPILNSRLCPALFCDARKELDVDDIKSLVDITPYRKVKTWLVQFSNVQFTAFIFEHRRKLSTLPQLSESSSPKLYVNPNLSPEDKAQQIKVLRAFNKLRFIGNDSSFSVFPQGFSIKIVYDEKKFFYSFD